MERKTRSLREAIVERSDARAKREIEDLKEGGWVTDYSNFADHEDYFSVVLNKVNLREYLGKIQNPTVIDLMAPGSALLDLFENLPQNNKLGISVSTLKDVRNSQQALGEKGIIHLVGDLLSTKTWKAIDQALDGRKTDLIVERGLSGIAFIPVRKDLYTLAARTIWNRLNPNGGIILAEIPSFAQFAELDVNLYAWKDKLVEMGINAEYFGGAGFRYSGKIFIQRLPDSPDKLPSL
jgi:hypothetical protein